MITDGDLGVNPNSRRALMKQKHRMVWERRNGPIGSKPRDPTPFYVTMPEIDINMDRGKRTKDSIEIPTES